MARSNFVPHRDDTSKSPYKTLGKMIFKRLLCLCTPGSSYRQVAPSEKEHDNDDVSGMQLMLFNIKKKFNNEESDTNNGNIERDCFSLVENIRIDGRDVTHRSSAAVSA